MQKLPVKFDFDSAYDDTGTALLKCPVCGFEYTHLTHVESSVIDPSRDELRCVLHFFCEGEHKFCYSFSHHKGFTLVDLHSNECPADNHC
jgi:hypothetical protein